MFDRVILVILDVEADLCCNVYLIWPLRCFHFLPQNTRISIFGLGRLVGLKTCWSRAIEQSLNCPRVTVDHSEAKKVNLS